MRSYKDRIRELISRLYAPADVTNYDVKMTTPEIYANLCTILPANAFDEYEVVEVLEDLNFFPGYESKEKVVERKVGQNEKGEDIIEVDVEEYDDLVFFWYMRKNQ